MFSPFFSKKEVETEDTRRHKRVQANYLVKFKPAGSDAAEPYVSTVTDISAGGLRFWTEVFIHENSLLSLQIWVPAISRTIDAQARVLRVRPSFQGSVYYISVEFAHIADEDRRALNDFIETLPSKKPVIPKSLKRIVVG